MSDVFQIDTLGDPSDRTLCFLEGIPQGTGAHYVRLAQGHPAREFVPARLRMQLQDRNEGLGLPSLVGNTNSFLIVATPVADLIEEHVRPFAASATDPSHTADSILERHPFAIIDHKGRVHSDDFALLNPLGAFDVVNDTVSEIEYFKGRRDMVVSIGRLVLDTAKLSTVPPLFRLEGVRNGYFVTSSLAEALAEGDFTNIVLRRIEHQPAE